jgi:LPXTG-motif cell wall-anchored protein
MKRISRHTVVALIIALLTSVGGMGVAVVAFGQDGPDQDLGIPAGDFTTTTPRQAGSATDPTSGYTTPTTTTPTATAPLSGYTNPSTTNSPSSTVTAPSSASEGTPTQSTSSGSSGPSTTHGKTPVATPSQPSRATRSGPTHLAFTGADPLLLGAAGAGLMLAGLGLHLRRRKATQLRL